MYRESWTLRDAVKFMRRVVPIAREAGYRATLVGGVADKGYSEKDLDILLVPERADYNFETIMEALPGEFTMYMDTYEHWTEDGRLVDFIVGLDRHPISNKGVFNE